MKRRVLGLLGGLAATQVAYGMAPQPRPERATRGVLGLLLATSAAEAAGARGRRGGALTALAGAVGFGVEVLGVKTGRPFGHYGYSGRLGTRVAGVPLLAGAAWGAMARPAWVAAGWVDARPSRRVPLAAAALTAWDVFLDPRMVRQGYWDWPAGGRYQGIPASNYAGWLLTSLGIFAAVAALDGGAPDARDDGALVLYAWTWIGETFAHAALWEQPVVAAAGGAAMGAAAVPAVRGRLR